MAFFGAHEMLHFMAQLFDILKYCQPFYSIYFFYGCLKWKVCPMHGIKISHYGKDRRNEPDFCEQMEPMEQFSFKGN